MAAGVRLGQMCLLDLNVLYLKTLNKDRCIAKRDGWRMIVSHGTAPARYFTAIAKHGTFSAAEQVFVAQSALSHQLAQLEDELVYAVPMPAARCRTDRGRSRLPAHATAILRQVDDARASVRNGKATRGGKVVLAKPHSASECAGVAALRRRCQQLPKVELELT